MERDVSLPRLQKPTVGLIQVHTLLPYFCKIRFNMYAERY
jgi:hypothetical protein